MSLIIWRGQKQLSITLKGQNSAINMSPVATNLRGIKNSVGQMSYR